MENQHFQISIKIPNLKSEGFPLLTEEQIEKLFTDQLLKLFRCQSVKGLEISVKEIN